MALGGRVTVEDLCARIRRLTGAEVEPRHDEGRPGDVRHSQAAVDLAREHLGYVGSVSLDEGLERTVAWYRARA